MENIDWGQVNSRFVISYVPILIPYVLAYIIYGWRKIDAKKIKKKDITSDSHSY